MVNAAMQVATLLPGRLAMHAGASITRSPKLANMMAHKTLCASAGRR